MSRDKALGLVSFAAASLWPRTACQQKTPVVSAHHSWRLEWKINPIVNNSSWDEWYFMNAEQSSTSKISEWEEPKNSFFPSIRYPGDITTVRQGGHFPLPRLWADNEQVVGFVCELDRIMLPLSSCVGLMCWEMGLSLQRILGNVKI